MAIFSNSRGKLIEISELPFETEGHIQKMVEDNMKTIFDIEFITSEFEMIIWLPSSLLNQSILRSFIET